MLSERHSELVTLCFAKTDLLGPQKSHFDSKRLDDCANIFRTETNSNHFCKIFGDTLKTSKNMMRKFNEYWGRFSSFDRIALKKRNWARWKLENTFLLNCLILFSFSFSHGYMRITEFTQSNFFWNWFNAKKDFYLPFVNNKQARNGIRRPYLRLKNSKWLQSVKYSFTVPEKPKSWTELVR